MSRDRKRIQPACQDAAGEGDTGVHLWLVLWKAYDAVRDYAARNIVSLGLGMSDFAVLELLLHKGPTPVNDIGEGVLLTSGSMTVAVDRLKARGLVRRRNDPRDRRARVVHLTAAGRRLIERAFAAHSAAMNELGDVLTLAERRRTIRMLKRLGFTAEGKVISLAETENIPVLKVRGHSSDE